MANAQNPNFPTGRARLITIDKMGNKVFFLDPEASKPWRYWAGLRPRCTNWRYLRITRRLTRQFMATAGTAIIRIRDTSIAVFDLAQRRHKGDFSVSPFIAPHGLRWGPAGQLYCVCEASGVVAEMDGVTGEIQHVIEVGSTNAHRIEVLPDGSKLYTENEEDPFATVVDLGSRRRLADIPAPNGLAGLGLSPDGSTIVLVDAKRPELMVVETATHEVVRTIRLIGHKQAAQIARYSPNGRYLVVTSNNEGIGTILHRRFADAVPRHVGKGSDGHGIPS